MKQPLLNKRTKSALVRTIDRHSHAILLTGESGTGLSYVSEYIEYLLKNKNNSFYKLVIKPEEKTTITIEQIRELRNVAKHKNTSNQNDIKVMVVISCIDDMQHQAQNALLKLLEEPPVGLFFVILCHDKSTMLSTIESRCINIPVLPVSKLEAEQYFDTNESLNKNYALSGGLPGLLVQLSDNIEHPLLEHINSAKKILSSTKYQRLCLVDSDFKTSVSANNLISALDKISRAALKTGQQKDKWLLNCLAILNAKERLSAKVQAKLVMDELFISLN